ncbi:MAG: prephenate dehydrogenase [Clostridia bacterium]|nr:prephenate dehydrogenase [Clostridia bacterium]
MKITIVGLGLIGGSIAKALAVSKKHEIYALDVNEDVLLDAMSSGVIRNKAAFEDLTDSDVVYLCMYPEGILDFVRANASHFGKNTIVTDVCGIKTQVYSKIKAVSEENGFIYIGAHPMAGKEVNTFAASDAALYFGASYILIKDNAPKEAFEKLESLAKEMQFGRIVYTTPEEHDKMIAFTSQLPHVLACAYVMSPECPKHVGFSAGSYRDVSRVAKINEVLWTDLFLSNRESLVDEIDILIDNITKIRNAVDSADADELKALLAKSREVKEIYG